MNITEEGYILQEKSDEDLTPEEYVDKYGFGLAPFPGDKEMRIIGMDWAKTKSKDETIFSKYLIDNPSGIKFINMTELGIESANTKEMLRYVKKENKTYLFWLKVKCWFRNKLNK